MTDREKSLALLSFHPFLQQYTSRALSSLAWYIFTVELVNTILDRLDPTHSFPPFLRVVIYIEQKHAFGAGRPGKSLRGIAYTLGVHRPLTTEGLASGIAAMVTEEYFVKSMKHVITLMLT